mmetsp:Transcript_52437/g.147148  ORF Transcript_52437/g.147148 Transcript_52437/m.147148 type:complete len:220 (+) Transcript_52437:1051-1710(+)
MDTAAGVCAPRAGSASGRGRSASRRRTARFEFGACPGRLGAGRRRAPGGCSRPAVAAAAVAPPDYVRGAHRRAARCSCRRGSATSPGGSGPYGSSGSVSSSGPKCSGPKCCGPECSGPGGSCSFSSNSSACGNVAAPDAGHSGAREPHRVGDGRGVVAGATGVELPRRVDCRVPLVGDPLALQGCWGGRRPRASARSGATAGGFRGRGVVLQRPRPRRD